MMMLSLFSGSDVVYDVDGFLMTEMVEVIIPFKSEGSGRGREEEASVR